MKRKGRTLLGKYLYVLYSEEAKSRTGGGKIFPPVQNGLLSRMVSQIECSCCCVADIITTGSSISADIHKMCAVRLKKSENVILLLQWSWTKLKVKKTGIQCRRCWWEWNWRKIEWSFGDESEEGKERGTVRIWRWPERRLATSTKGAWAREGKKMRARLRKSYTWTNLNWLVIKLNGEKESGPGKCYARVLVRSKGLLVIN